MSDEVRTKKKRQNDEAEAYAWTPEQSLDIMLKGLEVADNKWVERGLPKLVDEIAEDYNKHGGIKHIEGRDLPSKQTVIKLLEDLLTVIFPGYLGKAEITKSNTKYFLGSILNSIHTRLIDEVEKSLKYACKRIKECPEDVCLKRAHVVVKEFLQKLPEIRALVRGDIQAAYYGDPAAKSVDEVILSYPCVLAIGTYRIAHKLHMSGVPLIPRIMSEYAHSTTGIDIHPGAKIGRNFFIDHGTGVVIGETTEIGENVKLYQGVTLGALSFPKDERGRIIKGKKRHPTIGNNVVIYSGATILGGKTVIGDDAVVGGNVWITSSIPAGTEVTITQPELHYKKNYSTS